MTTKCVFVGDIGEGVYRSGASRLRGIAQLGVETVPFDAALWIGARRWMSRVNLRLFVGAEVRRRNEALCRVVRRHRPDVVWVDKGMWLYPRTLNQLGRDARLLVHYGTDDVYSVPTQNWLHRAQIKKYDLYLTTNRFNVLELASKCKVRAVRVGMGYDPIHHGAYAGERGRDRHVVFVGHWEPTTERLLTALIDAGLTVKVWGNHWSRAKHALLRDATFIAQADYAPTITTARLALCCLSKWNRNESTGRTLEIPALGGTLLAERTPEHEYLFRDGVEALLFDGPDELVRVATHHLRDGAAAARVAAAGQARCLSLGMTWNDHMTREWPIIERALSGSSALLPEDDLPFWPGFRVGRPYDQRANAAPSRHEALQPRRI